MTMKNFHSGKVEDEKPAIGRSIVKRGRSKLSYGSKVQALGRMERKLAEALLLKKSPGSIRRLRDEIASLREARSVRSRKTKKSFSYGSGFARPQIPMPEESLPLLQVLPLIQIRSRRQFVPQAIVSKPVETFAARESTQIIEGADGLDDFEGVAFALEGMPFTIMHYSGHPDQTSTIYLPREISDVDKITASIKTIIERFGLPKSSLVWQRCDDPDL